MTPRFLVIGTLVGGIVIFAWGTISHVLLPVSEKTMHEFTNAPAVAQAVRANAPQNGVYFAPQGIVAAVSMKPDMAEKTAIGPGLGIQFVTELAVAFFLCLVLVLLRPASPSKQAGALALVAIAAGIEELVPMWNWYGFSAGFVAYEFLDLVVAWFLAGLVLAALMRKLAPSRAAA